MSSSWALQSQHQMGSSLASRTDFKAVAAAVNEADAFFKDLKPSLDASALEAIIASGSPADPALAAARVPALEPMLESMTALESSIAGFRAKALEPDEDKRVYGAKMTAKVLALVAVFEALVEALSAELQALRPSFLAVQAGLAQSAASAEQAEAVARAAAEEAAVSTKRKADEALQEERDALACAQKAAEAAEASRLESLRAEKAAVEAAVGAARAAEDEEWARLCESVGGVGSGAVLPEVLTQLADVCGAEDPPDTAAFEATAMALALHVQKMNAHPEEAQLRNVRLSNPNFHGEIGCRPNRLGIKAFLAMGFREECKGRLDAPDAPDETFLILHEPDPFEKFDEWNEWMETIKLNKVRLNALVDAIKRYRRDGTVYTVSEVFQAAAAEAAQ